MKKKENKKHSEKIQSFLVSLHFLSKEAEREDFPKVQEIMVEAISNIEKWMDGKDPSNKHKVFDSSIYDAIEFLNKFSNLSSRSQKSLANLFDSMDETEILERPISKLKEVH